MNICCTQKKTKEKINEIQSVHTQNMFELSGALPSPEDLENRELTANTADISITESGLGDVDLGPKVTPEEAIISKNVIPLTPTSPPHKDEDVLIHEEIPLAFQDQGDRSPMVPETSRPIVVRYTNLRNHVFFQKMLFSADRIVGNCH
eukprot:m.109887 g.109887  ORF g.109887 m.109887 type:complete len:148 (+) comp14018_c0_seq4:614-1057(+)